MPLEFEAFPGVAGDALRVQRGAHMVYATGALTVLATMVPQFSAATRAALTSLTCDLSDLSDLSTSWTSRTSRTSLPLSPLLGVRS